MTFTQPDKFQTHQHRFYLLTLAGLIAVCMIAFLALGTPAQGPERPNIILLTVDTLRADRLTGYGYDRRTSPHLDAFMKEGIRFEDATAIIPLTNPSFSSVMTSHYPHETGATRNGLPMISEFPTIAELLKREGYATGAIISNWTLKNDISDLARGFDHYDEDFKTKRNVIFEEQDASDVTDLALAWIAEKKGQPFFAWVHYSDPHAPYLPREQFKFKPRKNEKKTYASYRYDTEVAYTDLHIGRFLKGLDKLGLKDSAFILFTADHGESLGEHDYTGHGRRVYQPGLHVPFAVVGPGIKERLTANVGASLMDVLPTILDYIGLTPPQGIRGISVLGENGGPRSAKNEARFYETYRGAVPAGAKKALKGAKPMRVGMREGRWKIIHSPFDDTRELYNLEADPGELDDLSSKQLERTAVMTRKSWEWFHRTQPAIPLPPRTLPPDVRRRLEALGYIQ